MDDAAGALLERDRELAAIDALVTGAAAGRGAALVLTGAPGIGKTSLVRAAMRRAADAGVRVLSVRLDELDSSVAFGVARDLLAAELVALPADEGEPALRRALFAFGSGNPALLEPDRSPPGGADGTEASMLHALYWVVAGLADRTPLLLAVDDAQWADLASLRFLGHLARRIEGLPVALLVAARPGGDQTAADSFAQISTWSPDQVLRPRPLTARGVAAVASASSDPGPVSDELRDALLSCTDGNPLALRELLGALEDAEVGLAEATPSLVERLGVRVVSARVHQRLGRVSTAAVDLARAVAVVGEGVAPDDIGSLVGLAPAAARAALAELVDAALMRGHERVRFVHPLMREAIRESTSPDLRDDLARAAARLLVELADDVGAARHLRGLRPAGDAWVVEVLLRAARVSVGRGAPDVACELLMRAALEPPPPDRSSGVLAALGRAQLALGLPQALTTLEDATRRAETVGARAAIAADLAQAMIDAVRIADAAAVLARSAEELRQASPDEAGATLADELELRMLMLGTWDPALRDQVERRLGSEHAAPVRHGAFAERLSLLLGAMESVAACRPASEGAALAESALEDGVLFDRAPSYAMIAIPLLVACGRTQQATSQLESMLERSRELGALPLLRACIGLRGQVRMWQGDVLAAETDGRAMQHLGEEGDLGPPYLLGFLTDALLAQGRVEDAADELERAGLTGPLPDLAPLNTILRARGRVRVAQGEREAGLADLMLCGERQRRLGQHNAALVPWRADAVAVLASLGRHDEAVVLADEDVALARRFGAPHVLGTALRARAGAGPATDLALLEEARDVLGGSLAALSSAEVHHDLGVALAAAEERAAARTAFTHAVELAAQLSAGALVERATAGLVAAGGRPRRRLARGAESLTPSERRVAELAVTGATNREIAQSLFVTEKTVETHLRRCYRKLGVGSRTQLASALGPDGGPDREDRRPRPR